MNNYTMLLPNYSVGENCYEKIPEYCGKYGTKAVVIGGKRAMAAAKPYLENALSGSGISISDFIYYGGEASYENVEILMADTRIKAADMIFAVGGGKAIDTCKCLGDKAEIPVFAFPTIASNCACCTSVSIMYRPDGTFIEPYFFLQPPIHAFINTKIMCEAPHKYLWAGMGDTYAKFYECTISSRDEQLEHYTGFGVNMSGMCVEPILQYGKKALEDNKNGVCSHEFKEVVLTITAVTALVSIYLTRDHTPDYNSGLAHAIFYTLTSVKNIEENHLHGEVVGFGVLICLLVDGQRAEFEKIYKFNKSVGLPTSLSDIEITREQMNALISKIPLMPDIRHNPYKVTEDMLFEAFDELEKYNNLI